MFYIGSRDPSKLRNKLKGGGGGEKGSQPPDLAQANLH